MFSICRVGTDKLRDISSSGEDMQCFAGFKELQIQGKCECAAFSVTDCWLSYENTVSFKDL